MDNTKLWFWEFVNTGNSDVGLVFGTSWRWSFCFKLRFFFLLHFVDVIFRSQTYRHQIDSSLTETSGNLYFPAILSKGIARGGMWKDHSELRVDSSILVRKFTPVWAFFAMCFSWCVRKVSLCVRKVSLCVRNLIYHLRVKSVPSSLLWSAIEVIAVSSTVILRFFLTRIAKLTAGVTRVCTPTARPSRDPGVRCWTLSANQLLIMDGLRQFDFRIPMILDQWKCPTNGWHKSQCSCDKYQFWRVVKNLLESCRTSQILGSEAPCREATQSALGGSRGEAPGFLGGLGNPL